MDVNPNPAEPALSEPRKSSANPPRVIVSIVAMGGAAMVVDCVRAILAGETLPMTVVIVENGGREALQRLQYELDASGLLGTSGSEATISGIRFAPHGGENGRPTILLCDPGSNLGYAGGNNVAIEQAPVANWDAVWVLNPDTIPEPHALAALIERAEETKAGIVGSRLIFTASGRVQTWGGMRWSLWLGRGRYLGFLREAEKLPDIAAVERRMDFVSGASMYVTRRFVEAVGPMDHAFFMYGEDVDWCLRGRRQGFRLAYAHGSVVRHIHGATAGSSRVRAKRSAFSIYFCERNKVLLMRKHLGALAPLAIAGAGFASIEYLVRTRSPRQFMTALRGWWAGARGETGYRKV